jgi:hypothetical protein
LQIFSQKYLANPVVKNPAAVGFPPGFKALAGVIR